MTQSSSTSEDAALAQAATALRGGGVVAHATEGVWGLAADALSEAAAERIATIKGRQLAQGFIVIGHTAEQFQPELQTLERGMQNKVTATWPGHVTWVLPTTRFGDWITGGRPTAACRVPGHDQARALAELFGGVLISTSANRTGTDALTDYAQVQQQLGAEVDFVLPGATLHPGKASTIRPLDDQVLRD